MKKPYENERPKSDTPTREEIQRMVSDISVNLRRGDIRAAQRYALKLAKRLHSVGLLPDTLELG